MWLKWKTGLRAHVLEFRDDISCYKLVERAIFKNTLLKYKMIFQKCGGIRILRLRVIFIVLTLDRSQFTFK